MNYVILDMEWDSVYSVKKRGFINQIIQIGAVKCDESFKIVGTFERTVKSVISKKVSSRFTELTGITSKDMLSGVSPETAVREYNDWVGTDFITLTWSNSDLFSIAENEKYILNGVKFKIEKYLDLQKYIQNEMIKMGFECKSQISLESAADILKVNHEGLELHTAKDDSMLCVGLLKKYYCKESFEKLIRDTASPDFYKRLYFKATYLDDINSSDINRESLAFKCDKCGEKAEKISKWRYKNRWFSARFRCNSCKRKFIGRISFKKNYEDITVKKRICEIKKGEKSVGMQSLPEKLPSSAN